MNESRPNEKLPSHMSDDVLIRELAHWGEKRPPLWTCSALAIQHKAINESRTSLRLILVACAIMATSIMSAVWLTQLRRPDASPREIAMEETPTAPDSELLLKSIAQRTQDIELRIEWLNAQRKQEHQVASETQELNARLLNTKRVAIRNAIVLSQIP